MCARTRVGKFEYEKQVFHHVLYVIDWRADIYKQCMSFITIILNMYLKFTYNKHRPIICKDKLGLHTFTMFQLKKYFSFIGPSQTIGQLILVVHLDLNVDFKTRYFRSGLIRTPHVGSCMPCNFALAVKCKALLYFYSASRLGSFYKNPSLNCSNSLLY